MNESGLVNSWTLPEDESELDVSHRSSHDPPRRFPLQAVIESARQLREAQGKLSTAEERCERIGPLVDMALKAKNDGNEELADGHQADAQAIRDNLEAAKRELQGARRALLQSLRVAAIEYEVARRALEQIEKLSPYPSVRVAGEILGLIDSLPPKGSPSRSDQAIPASSKLHLLPEAHPSQEDRKRLAELLLETIEAGRYKLAAVQEEMGLAEATLKRLRNAESVKSASWRKAVKFVREHHSDASR